MVLTVFFFFISGFRKIWPGADRATGFYGTIHLKTTNQSTSKKPKTRNLRKNCFRGKHRFSNLKKKKKRLPPQNSKHRFRLPPSVLPEGRPETHRTADVSVFKTALNLGVTVRSAKGLDTHWWRWDYGGVSGA